MYIINGWFPVVQCLCGETITLRKALVCHCGVTMRFRRVPGDKRHVQPLAVVPDHYDLAKRPVKVPFVVGWVEAR